MNVCIFGDSITWGATDNEKGGWAERLKAHFMIHRNEVEVYNLGIPGSKTEDWLVQWESEARLRDAGAIIFALGTNDSQYINSKDNPRVPLEQFKKNVEALIAGAKKLTQKIAWVGLTMVDESKTKPVPWAPAKNYDVESVTAYAAVIKAVCEKESVIFVPTFDVVVNADMEDGLHPGPAGHQKLFERILNTLEANSFFK